MYKQTAWVPACSLVAGLSSGQAIGSITLPATGGDRPCWCRLQFWREIPRHGDRRNRWPGRPRPDNRMGFLAKPLVRDRVRLGRACPHQQRVAGIRRARRASDAEPARVRVL